MGEQAHSIGVKRQVSRSGWVMPIIGSARLSSTLIMAIGITSIFYSAACALAGWSCFNTNWRTKSAVIGVPS